MVSYIYHFLGNKIHSVRGDQITTTRYNNRTRYILGFLQQGRRSIIFVLVETVSNGSIRRFPGACTTQRHWRWKNVFRGRPLNVAVKRPRGRGNRCNTCVLHTSPRIVRYLASVRYSLSKQRGISDVERTDSGYCKVKMYGPNRSLKRRDLFFIQTPSVITWKLRMVWILYV